MELATKLRLVKWLVQTDPVIPWNKIVQLAKKDPSVAVPKQRLAKQKAISGTALRKIYYKIWNFGRKKKEGTVDRELSEMIERCATVGRGHRVQSDVGFTLDDSLGLVPRSVAPSAANEENAEGV